IGGCAPRETNGKHPHAGTHTHTHTHTHSQSHNHNHIHTRSHTHYHNHIHTRSQSHTHAHTHTITTYTQTPKLFFNHKLQHMECTHTTLDIMHNVNRSTLTQTQL